MSYTPSGEGPHRYTVRVSPLPGELTTANNRRIFSAKVLRSTMRVLILAAAPGPDLSVIRWTLAEDPNVSVRALTQKLGGGFYEGALTRQVIDSADCILSIGMPDGRRHRPPSSSSDRRFWIRRNPSSFSGENPSTCKSSLRWHPRSP